MKKDITQGRLNTMTEIGKRIKKALEYNNMRQTDLVNIAGISKSALSSYISGKYEPKQNNIFLIAKALNVNEAWLMGKDVPMERIECIASPAPLPAPRLRPDEEQLLSLYNTLNETGQAKVLEDAENLTFIPKYTEREKAINA